MTLAEKTVEIALTQEHVVEQPPGSNRGPQVDGYLRAVGLDPAAGAYPWCAAFVSWCVYEAERIVGGPAQFRGGPGALRLLELNAGLRLDVPVASCVFVMDHGGGKGHAGLVLSVDGLDPDALHTLEGNTDANGSRTGGQVMRRVRRRAECAGFIRIA